MLIDALNLLGKSYSEWDKSKTAMKSERELAELFREKLLDSNLPSEAKDYTKDDCRLIFAYEMLDKLSYKERITVRWYDDYSIMLAEDFCPVLAQKRLKDALDAIGMTYEEWQNSDLRKFTFDDIYKAMRNNSKK